MLQIIILDFKFLILFKNIIIKIKIGGIMVRVELPAMVWHGERERILSIDFHPFTNQFVTGGSYEHDNQAEEINGYAKIWQINQLKQKNEMILFKYGLQKHQSNVNCVKFSPDGIYLATGSDDKSIVIWEQKQNFVKFFQAQKRKLWSPRYQLRGHGEEVMDLKWSSNSKYLVSGGMDKRVYIWQVQKNQYLKIFDEHAKFVQGIALDPKFKYILSTSNDRSVKIWKNSKTKKQQVAFYCHKTLKKINFPQKQIQQNKSEDNATFRMFFDQSIPTFFRRPDISPDGQLFLLPAGQWQKSPDTFPIHCAFLYRRKFLQKPSFYITTKGEPSVCARFCEKLFKKTNEKQGLFQQPYYMVFAIGTINSVLVYNTLNLTPLYGFGNYHYASITQLSWKNNSMLGVSSSDGFCSFMIFDKNQLGEQYSPTDEKLINLLSKQRFQKKQQKKKQIPVQGNFQTKVQLYEVNGQRKKKLVPVVLEHF